MNSYPIASLSDEELAEIPINKFRSGFLQRKYIELRQVREQILFQNWLNEKKEKIREFYLENQRNSIPENEVLAFPQITEDILERALQKNLKELYPLLLVKIITILEDVTEKYIQQPWEEEEVKEIRSLIMSSEERAANLFDYLLFGKNLTLYSYVRNRQDFGDVLEVLAQAKELRNKILHPHREKVTPLTTDELLEVWRSAVRFLLFTNAVATPAILNDLRQKLLEQNQK